MYLASVIDDNGQRKVRVSNKSVVAALGQPRVGDRLLYYNPIVETSYCNTFVETNNHNAYVGNNQWDRPLVSSITMTICFSVNRATSPHAG
jgi:hypothetical protein